MMTYSVGELRRASEIFLRSFAERAGDDIATLVSDIREGSPNRTVTDDPAAWYDWLRSLWLARGYELVKDISGGHGLVRLSDDRTVAVVVPVSGAPVWSEQLPGWSTVAGGFTELEGLRAFRELVRDRVLVAGVGSIAQLIEEVGTARF